MSEAGPSRSRSRTPPGAVARDSLGDEHSSVPASTGQESRAESPPAASPEVQDGDTRRAMMASAVAGLQRFKQSYLSIMVLKAGIGLGQVLALTVLLILASILPSPLYPSQRQRHGSPACPRPGLYEAWCITQIIRLTTCWSVSVWMLVRQERARRRRADVESAEAATEEAAALARQVAARELALRRLAPASGSPTTPADRAGVGGSAPPSLIHTDSSSSNTTVAVIPPTPPEKSEAQIEALALDLISTLPKTHQLTVIGADQTPVRRSLQQARELAEGRPLSVASLRPDTVTLTLQSPASGFVGWLDRNALRVSQSLGILSTILFILGNVLLFYPPPTSHSCYAASPMLWWGVMTVTAVGWVLFAQVFFVVIIVGLGGHVALSALRRAGLSPAPPAPAPERPAQPEPLVPAELSKLKVVCYVPAPNPTDSGTGTPEFPASRLPYPALPLPIDKALCAICQENFTLPEQGRTIMLKAEPLRLLGCGHVFHTACIDQWLLQGSGNCPFCNRSVRETSLQPPSESVAEGPAESRRRLLGFGSST